MEIREATTEDLQYARDHTVSRGKQGTAPEKIDYLYTVEDEGVPMAVGGFRFINATTVWCHVDLTDSAGKSICKTYRVIRDWINEFAKEHNIKRLQAYVRSDFDKGKRLVEHLGFEYEFTMKNFTEEGDADMYRRLI
jgi:hypothetical protein